VRKFLIFAMQFSMHLIEVINQVAHLDAPLIETKSVVSHGEAGCLLLEA